MVYLIIVLTVSVVLLVWSALTTCSLATFAPTAWLPSQLVGPQAYAALVAALSELPGVRPLEWDDTQTLLSVLPTPTSIERGFGVFLVVRQTGDAVVFLARPRLPLSMKVVSALRQVEREARMNAQARLAGRSNGGFAA